jgi:DNA-binding transcriptional regulator YhcF (GntR family)
VDWHHQVVDDTLGPQPLRRFDSLTSQTLSRRISRAVLTSILRGEIPSGHALPSEDELAASDELTAPVAGRGSSS